MFAHWYHFYYCIYYYYFLIGNARIIFGSILFLPPYAQEQKNIWLLQSRVQVFLHCKRLLFQLRYCSKASIMRHYQPLLVAAAAVKEGPAVFCLCCKFYSGNICCQIYVGGNF